MFFLQLKLFRRYTRKTQVSKTAGCAFLLPTVVSILICKSNLINEESVNITFAQKSLLGNIQNVSRPMPILETTPKQLLSACLSEMNIHQMEILTNYSFRLNVIQSISSLLLLSRKKKIASILCTSWYFRITSRFDLVHSGQTIFEQDLKP